MNLELSSPESLFFCFLKSERKKERKEKFNSQELHKGMDRGHRESQCKFFRNKTEPKLKTNREARKVMEADRVHNNLRTRLERVQAEKLKSELSQARS